MFVLDGLVRLMGGYKCREAPTSRVAMWRARSAAGAADIASDSAVGPCVCC